MPRCLISLVFAALGFGADFVTDIHPLFANRCLGCHSGAAPQGKLDLTTREGALRVLSPGSPEKSSLIARVEGREDMLMPPTGKALSAAEIAKLREWIAEGAPWVDVKKVPSLSWIPPLEPRTVALPAGEGNPIDRFLGKPANGLAANGRFAHRAYLDVWGITPNVRELGEFEASKNRKDLVRKLLANDRLYAGHWMSWWNDLLRNDIGVVYHGDRKAITPWLERALLDNMPYDEMVRELLNPIGNGSPEGFLIGVNWRGDVNASQTPYMQASQNTAQIFLGINLKCASCHDSFINRYKLKEAYGLAAMFSENGRLELVRCDNRTGVMQDAQFLWPELGAIPANLSTSERRLWASRLFTHPKNGRLARTIVNRYWQKLMGRGLVEPVDDMDAKPSNPDLLDWLAADFTAHGFDLKYLIELILTSEAYQRADAFPRRISAEEFTDTLSALTGEWRATQSASSDRAVLARDWQLKSTPLTRAMGRPIRDQVFTTRNEDSTTFQGLELSNGTTLAAMIHRGVMRLMGELPDPPDNLFDSKAMRGGELKVEVPVRGLRQVWLLTEDAGTYDPDKTVAGWKEIELSGPAGTKTLEAASISTKLGSRMVYEIAPGYDTLRAKVWISEASKASDVGANVRFFVFGAEPDRDRLIRLAGDRPSPAPLKLISVDETISRFWRQLLSRDPSAEERAVAARLFPGGKLQREGAEDLLWSLLMHPEFQFKW